MSAEDNPVIERGDGKRRFSHSTLVSAGFIAVSLLWTGITEPLFAKYFPQSFAGIALWNGWIFALVVGLVLKIVLAFQERRNAVLEAQLREAAIHDPLTQLFNRGAFHSHLEVAIERARRRKVRLGLAFLDLDNFKVANDTFGHDFGDELIKAVAERLRGILRSSDIAGRVGGDEFVVMVEPDEGDGAEVLARRLLNAFREPIEVAGLPFPVTMSIGVAHFPDHANEAGQLVRAADQAMYMAKGAGRNGFRLAG